MKSLPTQARAVRKRQALVNAAVNEFSSAGFEDTTAKSIAAKAGVATGTFYQYFENKNDILRVIAHDRFTDLQNNIPSLNLNVAQSTSAEQLVDLFKRSLSFVYEFHAHDPMLHQILEHRRNLDPKLHELMQQGEAVLQERVLKLVLAMNVEHAPIVANNLFSMAEGIVHRQAFDENDHELELVLTVGAKMLASYFVREN